MSRGTGDQPLARGRWIASAGKMNLGYRIVRSSTTVCTTAAAFGAIASWLACVALDVRTPFYFRLYFHQYPIALAFALGVPVYVVMRLVSPRSGANAAAAIHTRSLEAWRSAGIRRRLTFYLSLFGGAFMFAVLGWIVGGLTAYSFR